MLKTLTLLCLVAVVSAAVLKRNPRWNGFDAPELSDNDRLDAENVKELAKREIRLNMPESLVNERKRGQPEQPAQKMMMPQKNKAPQMVGDIWSPCGNSSDLLQIVNVTITPDPPVIGQAITIVANGNLLENVQDGSIHILLYWAKIRLVNETVDLCSVVIPPITCPIPQGPLSLKVNQQIPSNAPPGLYSGTVRALDSNGNELTCIGLKFQMTASAEVEAENQHA